MCGVEEGQARNVWTGERVLNFPENGERELPLLTNVSKADPLELLSNATNARQPYKSTRTYCDQEMTKLEKEETDLLIRNIIHSFAVSVISEWGTDDRSRRGVNHLWIGEMRQGGGN